MCTVAMVTDAMVHCPFSQQLGIVDSLGSRQDLFSSHKHVIRVGVFLQGEYMKFDMNREAFDIKDNEFN